MLFEHGLPHDEAASEAANHLQGSNVQIHRGSRDRRRRRSDNLDVRSERRVRADQRRVSDLDSTGERPDEARHKPAHQRSKDFLSVLDLTPGELWRLAGPGSAAESGPASGSARANRVGAGRRARGVAVRKAVLAYAIHLRSCRQGARRRGPESLGRVRRRTRTAGRRGAQPRTLGARARGADVCAGASGASGHLGSPTSRDQRAHRRTASLPGARRWAENARSVGRLPRPAGGIRRRRQQRRHVARARHEHARHHAAHRVTGGLRASRPRARGGQACRARRRDGAALPRSRRSRRRRRRCVHGRLGIDGRGGEAAARKGDLCPIPSEHEP